MPAGNRKTLLRRAGAATLAACLAVTGQTLFSTPARAETVSVIAASHSGAYIQTGRNFASSATYLVGSSPLLHEQFRDYFTFDLSGISGVVVSAILNAPDNGDINSCGADTGPVGTWTMHEVTTAVDVLTTQHNGDASGLSAYADLGDGTVLGSLSGFTPNTDHAVSFNAAGLAAVQAAEGGNFAVGGTYAEGANVEDSLFDSSKNCTPSLTVVTKLAQTITFAGPASPVSYGDPDIALSATASSNLPVSFTTTGPCSVNGTSLTLTGAGDCEITASQPGDSQYAAAASVTRSLQILKAPTTTTVVAVPNPSSINQEVVVTATVTHPGTNLAEGTVTFQENGRTLGSAGLDSSGTASITTTFGGGSHPIIATYSGDANYLGSTSAATTLTVPCTTTLTGAISHGITVTSGTTCVIGATISGGISVAAGGRVDLENSTVSGSISANAPAVVRICGSTTGSIGVSGATGSVEIGSPSFNCAGNTINGSVTLSGNHGLVVLSGNTISGPWLVANNTGQVRVSGNHH